MTQSPRISSPSLDRFFWLTILISAAIVIPRSILITRAHSPCADAQFHLRRGLYYLTGEPKNLNLFLEDGLLGQALGALPMVITGSTMTEPIRAENLPPGESFPPPSAENPAQKFARIARQDVLLGHALSPDALLLGIAIWKSILFLPFAALIFHWSRWLYGLQAGFIALAMLLIDPSFAAHIPLATIDVLSAETIIFACFTLWLWVRNPNLSRMILAAFASAFALLTKQIAVVIPLAAIGYLVIWQLRNPAPKCETAPRNNRMFLNRLAGFFLLFLLFIWALTKFDCSTPSDLISTVPRHQAGAFSFVADTLYPSLQHCWPAGQYIAAFINGVQMDLAGRWAFLLGHARVGGWWYYYPVLLALKAPLGFFAIFLLAIFSLWRRPPFFDEWSLLLPAILWGALLLSSNVNIGIRHFLPEYALLILLASRCVSSFILHPSSFILRVIAWLALIFSAASASAYHPDYLSYINYPYQKPWLLMNDSNIDWGQGLKQVRQYLDSHPSNRPVYIRYDWDPVWVNYYIDGRATRLTQFQSPPRHGLLIICPVWIAGYWDPMDTYAYLRSQKPIAIIGHSMLVYNLDHPFK